jgi:hypothetical protein
MALVSLPWSRTIDAFLPASLEEWRWLHAGRLYQQEISYSRSKHLSLGAQTRASDRCLRFIANMTPKQRDILAKLFLGNLIVYVVLALFAFAPPLPQVAQLAELLNRPTAVALKQATALPRLTFPATYTPMLSPAPTRVVRPVARSVRPPAPPVASPTPPATYGGDSPSDPLTPADSWQTLGAGARVWYIIGSGGVHMDVFLEAKPLDGITMEVYAPGQLDQPIGHGTFQAASGSLVWAGGHWQSEGDWFARVINGNSFSVQYKLTSSAKNISGKSCYSYWENIGDARVYWTKCQ